MFADLTIVAPAWAWLVPVWIVTIICGTAIIRDLLKRR